MDDIRVWLMTLAAVGALALVAAVCGGGVLLFGMRPIPVQTGGPIAMAQPAAAMGSEVGVDVAVVLEATQLYPEPETAAIPLKPLPPGELLTVFERSTKRKVCRDAACLDLRHQPLEFDPEGEGSFWYRVAARDGTEGWVFGRFVAIRVDSPHVAGLPDLGWGDRGLRYEDLDGDGLTESMWFGVGDVAYEYPSGMLDRTPSGYLVMTNAAGSAAAVYPVGGILIAGYGDRLGELTTRDANGDGVAELVLRIDTTVSEVGYGGHEVVILRYRDGQFEELFREHATISLIAGVGEIRWARIDVGAGEIVQDVVDLEVFSKCRAWTIDEPDTALDRCLRGERRVWRWDHEAQAFALVSEETALQVQATTGPTPLSFRAEPDLEAPVAGSFPAHHTVRVQRIHDWNRYAASEELEGHWVRAVDGDGQAGWVASSRLRFAEGMVQPYMNGDDTAEGQVDPVVF